MYGGILLLLMRLLGQATPSELRVLGQSVPSSTVYLAQHILILVTIGGSLTYGEIATYEDTIEKSKGKMVAYVVMTGLAKISGAFAFFFLVIRNMILHKNPLSPILKSAKHFDIDRSREEKRFQFLISVFLVILFCTRVWFVIKTYLEEDSAGTFWGLIDSFSFILSNFYLMLFATKLVFLTRMVRFNFLVANQFFKRNHIRNQQKSCKAAQDELDRLLNLQWKAHDFLKTINVTFGMEWAVIVTYFYLAILKYLYNASIASALFSAEDPDIPILTVNLFQAGQEIVMSIIVLGNGSLLTKEAKHTLALVWSSVPDVHNENSRKKLISSISLMGHLSSDLSAHGIFKLNMKTFCHIISSVATQLVILISMGNQ